MTEQQKPSIGLIIICCVLLALLLGLIGLAAFGADGEGGLLSGGVSASEEYTGVTTLYIETGSANVILTPSKDNTLRTNLPSNSGFEVYYDGDSGDLWIEQRSMRRGLPFFFDEGETTHTIRIEVPYVFSVGVETVSGNIEVDISGASGLHLATSNGDIFLSSADVTGEITASTSSGDIDMRGFYADSVYITSNSGPVRLVDIYCADIAVYTESGSQTIAPMMGAQLNLMSGSGDIFLYPAEPLLGSVYTQSGSVSLRAENGPQSVLFFTQSGNSYLSRGGIYTAPPDGDGAVRYDVDGQGPQLDITTQSGSLTIE